MNLRAILEYQIFRIGDYTLTVSNVLGVLLIWLTVWVVLRLARRIIYKGLKSMAGDRGRRHSLFLIVQYIAWVLGTMGMFRVVGLEISVLRRVRRRFWWVSVWVCSRFFATSRRAFSFNPRTGTVFVCCGCTASTKKPWQFKQQL